MNKKLFIEVKKYLDCIDLDIPNNVTNIDKSERDGVLDYALFNKAGECIFSFYVWEDGEIEPY